MPGRQGPVCNQLGYRPGEPRSESHEKAEDSWFSLGLVAKLRKADIPISGEKKKEVGIIMGEVVQVVVRSICRVAG